MKYFKFFCVVFSTIFFVGFYFGWKDSSNEKFDDCLIRNVRIDLSNIDSSNKGVILLFVKDDDTLIKYSIDSSRIIEEREWMVIQNLGLAKPDFPFLAQLRDVRGVLIDLTAVSLGAYIMNKIPPSPKAGWKFICQLDEVLKIENNDQRIKNFFAGILGSVSGFLSGYYFAERVFSPSKKSNALQSRINNKEFWQKATTSMWYGYIEDLKYRYAWALSNSNSKAIQDSIVKFHCWIDLTKTVTLFEIKNEKRTLNSFDFLRLFNYEKTIHSIYPSDKKWFNGTEEKSNWVDYIIYLLIAIVNLVTITILFFKLKSIFASYYTH